MNELTDNGLNRFKSELIRSQMVKGNIFDPEDVIPDSDGCTIPQSNFKKINTNSPVPESEGLPHRRPTQGYHLKPFAADHDYEHPRDQGA